MQSEEFADQNFNKWRTYIIIQVQIVIRKIIVFLGLPVKILNLRGPMRTFDCCTYLDTILLLVLVSTYVSSNDTVTSTCLYMARNNHACNLKSKRPFPLVPRRFLVSWFLACLFPFAPRLIFSSSPTVSSPPVSRQKYQLAPVRSRMNWFATSFSFAFFS